ncbi:MAG: glycosyltransferase family 39 protein [Proteobacteria bacterium]|nr:glycosyltransferase family 39 protein [Pseudomonadota bacterium]
MKSIKARLNITSYQIPPTVLCVFIISVFSLFGFIIMSLATNNGLGLSVDSMSYVDSARNLLQGKGFASFSGNGHFPPFYPMLLAVSGIFFNNILDGAAILHALLFCVNIAFAGYIMFRESGNSLIAACLASIVILTSPTMLNVHSMAWSEPLFLLLSVAGLYLLSNYLKSFKKKTLAGAAILTALAVLTRYAGVANVAAGCVAIIFLSRQQTKQKVFGVLIFSVLSVLPISLWVFKNYLLAGSVVNRGFSFHPIDAKYVTDAVSTLAAWFYLPPDTLFSIKLCFVLLIIVVVIISVIFLFRKQTRNFSTKQNPSFSYLPIIALIFSFSYILMLFINSTFFDAHTPFDDRILSPLLLIGFLGTLNCILSLIRESPQRIAILFYVFLSGFVMMQFLTTTVFLSEIHAEGRGYARKDIKELIVIKMIKSLPSGTLIYSNGPDAMFFLTGREIKMIPLKVSPTTRQANEHFEDELKRMWKKINNESGILVILNFIEWRWYLPDKKELEQKLSLQIHYQGQDGTIYKADASPFLDERLD